MRHTLANSLSLLPFASLLAVAEYLPERDANCPDNGICMTSFKFEGRDPDGERGIYLQKNVVPYNLDSPHPDFHAPILYDNLEFNVTWKNANPVLPVELGFALNFFVANFSYVDWAVNLTNNDQPFTFRPYEILEAFPTPQAPNRSRYEAVGLASQGWSAFLIRQPGSGIEEADQSDYIRFWDSHVRSHVDSLRRKYDDVENRWRKGVGIGVGVGVPILLIIVVVATKRWTRKRLFRDGKLKLDENENA